MKRLIYPFLLFIMSASALWPANYEVGPQKPYSDIGGVPWEGLSAGDSVLIYWREAPYNEKWVICLAGETDRPIVIKGIPNQDGSLPVIDGNNALTRKDLNYWGEERSVIKVGGANKPQDLMPKNIIIENLDIRSGRPPYGFTGRNGKTDYVNNCAAIFVEKGENITIRNCILHDCGNGLFAAHQAKNLLVEYNYIYDNGIEDDIYEHNNYTEADGIVFQFNRFGPLRTGCLGNNLKDRSKGCVVRYNLIEAGNRQLDLVDTDFPEFYNDPKYNSTYVYGNILIEYEDSGNNQIVHYGGDSGDKTRYRKGMLYFYNNTVISYRSGNTTLVRLSSEDENIDVRNNIIYLAKESGKLGLIAETGGTLTLQSNYLNPGWTKSHSSSGGGTIDVRYNIEGNDPGLRDPDNYDFRLVEGSKCIDAGAALLPEEENFRPESEYEIHRKSRQRVDPLLPDIGAYAAYTTGITIDRPVIECRAYPSVFSACCHIDIIKGWSLKICRLDGPVAFTATAESDGRSIGWTPGPEMPTGVYLVKFAKGHESVVTKVIYVK